MYDEKRNALINSLSSARIYFSLGMKTEELEKIAKENKVSVGTPKKSPAKSPAKNEDKKEDKKND